MLLRRPWGLDVLRYGWPAVALLAVLSGCISRSTPAARPVPEPTQTLDAPAVDPDARSQPDPGLTPLPPNPEEQAVAESAGPDVPMATPGESPPPPATEPEAGTGTTAEATPEPGPEPGDGNETTSAPPPLHPGWDLDSAYNRLYVVDSEAVTLDGTIDSVGTFVPAAEAEPGLMLELRAGGEAVAVHTAPLRYLRGMGVRFDFGESLSVEGRWAELDGQRVLLAQAITRGETRVVLRDAVTGRPAWLAPGEADEPGSNEPADSE